ncbi:sigma-70 family RNA polymerase sigma factor [Pseudomonas syringae pv. actinidiae]|nr:sigma-70 family RNA polymerase sigma factor [Pseudomonas syringae pv. actinidiae]
MSSFAAQACGPLLSDSDVYSYALAVKSQARLSPVDERALLVRYRVHGDIKARDEVIKANLWVSVWCVRKFRFTNLSEADLIQEANIGLLKAIDRFDINADNLFSSYAVAWVRCEIHNFMISNWRSVKVATTKARRKVFHNLYKLVDAGERISDEKIAQVAQHLSVTVKDVQAVATHMNQDVRMHSTTDSSGEEIEGYEGFYSTDAYSPETIVFAANEEKNTARSLIKAFDILNDRERDIINSRWMGDEVETLGDLSGRYSVSAERIRQLEKKALVKMRSEILAA